MSGRIATAYLMLIAATGLVRAQEQTFRTVETTPGKLLRLGLVGNVTKECTPGPLPEIQVATQPSNGTLAIRSGKSKAGCQWRRDFRPVRRRKTRPRQAIAGKVCDQRFSRLCGRMSPQLGGGSAASSAVARVRVAWFSTAPAARARRPFECVRR